MLSPLTLCLALAAAPSPDGRAASSILVTVDGAAPAGVDAASIGAAAAAAFDFRPRLAPVPAADLFGRGEQVQGQVEDCGSDEPCIGQILQGLGIQYGLLVTARAVALQVTVDVRLFQAADGGLVTDATRRAAASAPAVLGAVRAAVTDVLDGVGFEQLGALRVRTEPPGAVVRITGGIEVVASGSEVVAPGRYRVHVSAQDHRPQVVEVEIVKGQRAEVDVKLPRQGRPLYKRGWFWGVVGAVAVTAGVGIAVAAGASSSDAPCFCVTAGSAACMQCGP